MKSRLWIQWYVPVVVRLDGLPTSLQVQNASLPDKMIPAPAAIVVTQASSQSAVMKDSAKTLTNTPSIVFLGTMNPAVSTLGGLSQPLDSANAPHPPDSNRRSQASPPPQQSEVPEGLLPTADPRAIPRTIKSSRLHSVGLTLHLNTPRDWISN